MRRAVPLARLEGLTDPRLGLTTRQARDRLLSFGANDIIETVPHGWWDLVRDTARDPMLWFLAGTGGLYAFLGDTAEAITLLVALIPFVGMDAFLHRRTQASTEGLQSRLATRARVVRDGQAVELAVTEVVPGDLALVSTGDAFPADGLIVEGDQLQADESSLTGEAYPVPKRALPTLPVGDTESVVDGTAWALAGTRLLTGRASLRVVFTGADTLYGEIVRSAVRGRHSRTPLQAAVSSLTSVLVVAAAILCLILAFVRLRQGHGWLDAFVSAVTLAVAALPEEFPVAFTFFLAVGVYRLAKRQALVRRAVTVENIGRVTCICSDKTGTITQGRLRVTRCLPATDVTERHLLGVAALASRRETGDPLDAAVLDEAEARGGLQAADPIATFPFTEDRRRETAILKRAGTIVAATKGSPEVILEMCSLTRLESDTWASQVSHLAEGGHKVIACASRTLDEGWPGGEPTRGFRFVGLLVCEDAVRDGVAEAVQLCREAGIHTLMVTGDHPATAAAVARTIGLGDREPVVICGEDLEDRLQRKDADFRRVDVIARAIPSQKLGLVRALQSKGEIVAVTGDGVNDVPALQAADIGVAMGERGTRSAREAASIVLLDDNFRTIVGAVAEGRQLFRNLQLSFQYLLMIHIPLVITATLIPLAGYPLLYLPIHIVWVEMIIHPTALLVFQELPTGHRLDRLPSSRHARFFSAPEWTVIAAVGALLTVLLVAGYDRSLGADQRVEHARAMALVVLTVASAALAAILSRLRTPTSRVVVAGTLATSVLLVQVPSLATRLHLQPLHLDDWTIAVAGSLLATSLLGLLPLLRSIRRARAGVRSEDVTPRLVGRIRRHTPAG